MQQFRRYLLIHIVVFDEQNSYAGDSWNSALLFVGGGSNPPDPRGVEELHQNIEKSGGGDWLLQESLDTVAPGLRADLFLSKGGDDDNLWHISQAAAFDESARFQSVHPRHLPIQEDQSVRVLGIGDP